MRILSLILPVIYSTDPFSSNSVGMQSGADPSSTGQQQDSNISSTLAPPEVSSALGATPVVGTECKEEPCEPNSVAMTEEEERRKRREMVYQAALARMQRFQVGGAARSISPPGFRPRTFTTSFGSVPRVSLDAIASLPLATKGPGHRGLPNLGMTCFINAAMQVLMNSQAVRQVAASVNGTIFEEQAAAAASSAGWKRAEKLRLAKSFAELTNMYWSGDNTTNVDLYEHTRALVTSLNTLDPETFVRGRMGDSHEVIKAVLDAFPMDGSARSQNPMESLFQTVGEEKRKMCLACERYDGAPNYEPLQELIMKTELVGRAQSVNLQEYVTAVLSNSVNETIEGVECSACSANGTSVRQTVRLESTTVVRGNGSLLLVPLPRFQMGSMLKNTVSVEISMNLTMSTVGDRFDLIGVVYHAGSTLNFGHYTASFVDHMDGKWYNANDGIVREIETPVLTGETPYLLVYQRNP